jgi:hypothetical protein
MPMPGMPGGIGLPLGIGVPVGVGVGVGVGGSILSIGIPIWSIVIGMPQHMPSGLGALGACCCEAFAGPSVNAPEELVQVPAKKLATAIVANAKTAATVRLRLRRLAPTLLKKLIVKSSRSEWRMARQATTSHSVQIANVCLLPMYIDSRPAGGVGHVHITWDFGADPMSIWPCSADHGYDSHDILGAPAFWSYKTLRPVRRETSRTSSLAEASDPRLSRTPFRKSATSDCLKCLRCTASGKNYYLSTYQVDIAANASNKRPRRGRNRQCRQVN